MFSEMKANERSGYELIDTWWDVNFDIYRFFSCLAAELIDTWWDVNIYFWCRLIL